MSTGAQRAEGGQSIATIDHALADILALPTEAETHADLQAIQRFQKLVQSQFIEGHDFGTIPGTSKPTLLKPGAEKLTKLLKCAATYPHIDRVEKWDPPFFHYVVTCHLVKLGTDIVFEEGVGSCNSMEGRYRYRWLWGSELDAMGITDHSTFLSRQVNRKGGGGKVTQYRTDNDDIATLANTILKMAKKRALVDAALSAGRLSDIFTQDLEDMRDTAPSEGRQVTDRGSKHFCEEHRTEWFKKGKMENYAHPHGDGWCNMPKTRPAASPAEEPTETPSGLIASTFWAACREAGWEQGKVLVWLGVSDMTVYRKQHPDMTWDAIYEEVYRLSQVAAGEETGVIKPPAQDTAETKDMIQEPTPVKTDDEASEEQLPL